MPTPISRSSPAASTCGAAPMPVSVTASRGRVVACVAILRLGVGGGGPRTRATALVGIAVVGVAGMVAALAVQARTSPLPGRPLVSGLAGVHLENVARRVGLDFRQGAFRFGISPDPPAETGGGLCWLDYDNDGWLDLFVVNSYSNQDITRWPQRGGLPRSALFHNLHGHFTNVSRRAHASLAMRGQGCVATDGDPNRLYQNVAWPGGKKADPDGLGFRFEERAGSAGVADPNAGMGVAVGDFNGDGRSDLFVSNSRGQGHAVYLGQAPTASGATFTDVRSSFATAFGRSFTGWGAAWVDLDLDGDPDLVLANGGIPVTNLARNAQPIQVLENRALLPGLGPDFTDGTALVGGLDLPRVVGRGLAAADF